MLIDSIVYYHDVGEENMKAENVQKKAYQKPVVNQVNLIAANAVLGTCKINFGTYNTCRTGGDLRCGGQTSRT